MLLAVGLPLLGAAATSLIALAMAWARQGARLVQIEAAFSKLEAVKDHLADLDGRQRSSAESQGGRLEAVEKLANSLQGELRGFQGGFISGRRSRTAAKGEPIEGER